jgi:hypothetical protein
MPGSAADAATPPEAVSRRRYERERAARAEAERLLEAKSRALFASQEALRTHAATLEKAFAARSEQLKAAMQAAESANAAKSGFLAMISHEIRTPLNGVLGMATVLAETELSAEQQDMAQTILSSGHSLLSLLNDVLDLTKIEARKMELEACDTDLPGLCQAVAGLYRERAREKGLTLGLEVNASARRRVRVDPTRLRQVMGNLVSNAIKFTATGGVQMHLRQSGDLLELRVRDSGPGVPPERRARLFEAFAQADETITRRFGGTGLGLAISQQICRLMGGDLLYHPVPGGGSCFVATVRVARAGRAAAPVSEARLAVEDVLRARPWRVLAAEDSATNRKVLRLLLRGFPFEMGFAENGAEAVESHCRAPVDVILMDVNMPVLNGLEAAAMIRQSEAALGLARVPIIALTANAMTHQVADYLRQGIDAHVAKPVRREDLCAAMARLLAPRLAPG